MNRITTRWASVVLLAAVALIFTPPIAYGEAAEAKSWAPAALARTPAHPWPYPSIISSFRLTGATPPGPCGIHSGRNSVFVISYTAPGENYLYEFSLKGSFVSSLRLRGANAITETDWSPYPYPRDYFSALDAGTRDVKIFRTTGSFVGTFMAAPADAVAIGVGGRDAAYVYLATRGGLIRRYSSQGSFLNSFGTGINVNDLAASGGYYQWWGNYVQVAPRGQPGPIYCYTSTGSLEGSFALPGTASYCAETIYTSFYWCLRRVNTRLWVYQVFLGGGMPVAPASLGRIKALYK